MEPESRRPPWTRILSIPREQETYHTRVIFFGPNVAIIFLGQRRHNWLALTAPDLPRQYAARSKPRRGLRDQLPHQLVPVRACEKGHCRLVQHLSGKIVPFF